MTLELCLFKVSSHLQIVAYTHIRLQMKVEMSFSSILDFIFLTVMFNSYLNSNGFNNVFNITGKISVYFGSKFSLYEDYLEIRCASRRSPPTQVVWKKYGEELNVEEEDQYHMKQSIISRYFSRYYTYLYVFGSIEDTIGRYSCTMINPLGSVKDEVNVRGK